MGQFVVVGTGGSTSSQVAMPVVLVNKDTAAFYNASLVGGSGGTASTDDAAFTPAVDALTPVGGIYRSTRDDVNDGDTGAYAMNIHRAQLISIEDGTGTSAMDNTNHALQVNVVAGSTAGTSYADKAAFTEGTSGGIVPAGAVFNDTITGDPAEDQITPLRITAKKGLHINLRTTAGAETGIAALPLQVSLANHAANATPVTVGGTITNLSQLGGQAIAMGTGVRSAGTLRVTVATDDIVPASQSGTWNIGTVTTVTGVTAVTSLTQMNGQAIAMGTGVRSAGTQRVTIATDDVVPASQSGTWNIGTVTTVTGVTAVTSLTQMNGQAIAMGTGVRSAGTQRVTIATDDVVPASQSGTWNIGTVTTCSTVTNLSQMGGQAIAMGTGVRSAGTLRVTVATDDVVPVTQSTAASLKGQMILLDSGGTNLVHVNADGGLQTTGLPTGYTDTTTVYTASITGTGDITCFSAGTSRAIKEVYIGGQGFGPAARATIKRNSGASTIGDIYLSAVNFISKDKIDFGTTDMTVSMVTDNASAMNVYAVVKYYS